MKTHNPLVSVVLPVYNGEKFIAEAIESVLGQSVKPYEIIVVNDGSIDDTELILEQFGDKIRYVNQENNGIAAARNKGLKLSRGNLIGFIDADDIWIKNRLEIQVKLLNDNPETAVVLGLLRRFFGAISKEESGTEIDKKTEKLTATSLGNGLFRREVFEKVGNFDEEMKLGEDVDYFFRILEAGVKVKTHNDVVQLYRQHDKNVTKDKKKVRHYILKAIKKSLSRRRENELNYSDGFSTFGNLDEIFQRM